MDDPEVRRTIKRAKKLDPEAIGVLYDQNFAAIYNYFRHRVGDAMLAEDLTSQLFLKMVHALPEFRLGEAPFRSWLFGIARNLVADHFRKEKATAVLFLDEMGDTIGAQRETVLLNTEVEVVVKQAISEITSEQREVVLLRFFADLTHQEIAGLLGKTEASVKMLQKRALESLAKKLGGGVLVDQ